MLVGGFIPLLPLGAALLSFRRLTRTRLLVCTWSFFIVAATVGSRLVLSRDHTNLWTSYLIDPVEGVLALTAIAQLQTRTLLRTAIIAAIPASVVAFALLVLLVENTSSFSRVSSPMYALLCLAAALVTLTSRAIDEPDSLLRQDWFWFTGGMALYFGAFAALTPLGFVLVHTRPDLVLRAYDVYALATIVAFLAIGVGMLCPTPQLSGTSSSAPFSASELPSSPSALR